MIIQCLHSVVVDSVSAIADTSDNIADLNAKTDVCGCCKSTNSVWPIAIKAGWAFAFKSPEKTDN